MIPPPPGDLRWQADAACLTIGGDIFHTPDTTDTTPTNPRNLYTAAQAICQRCPVKADCLAAAMLYEQGAGPKHRHGVWGGLTPVQRYRLAGPVGQPSAPHGTEARYTAHRRNNEQPCPECVQASAAAKRRRQAERQAAA